MFCFFHLYPRTVFFIAFRERGRKRERGRERNINVRDINWLPPLHIWTGDWSHNLDMCPDQELNLQPFSYRMTLQPTEQHWPGCPQVCLKCHHCVTHSVSISSCIWSIFHCGWLYAVQSYLPSTLWDITSHRLADICLTLPLIVKTFVQVSPLRDFTQT